MGEQQGCVMCGTSGHGCGALLGVCGNEVRTMWAAHGHMRVAIHANFLIGSSSAKISTLTLVFGPLFPVSPSCTLL